VDRETTLIGSLTVREFLYYSALLQLPGFFCQKKSVVEDAIHAMSLGEHANKLIGGHCYMKGLPSGERRLVSIARELVMRPRILFLDEPLYHLDRYLFYFSIHFSVIIVYFVLEIIPYLEQFSLTSFSLFIYF
jgi:ABC-type multidrug transport system ATPase subunit